MMCPIKFHAYCAAKAEFGERRMQEIGLGHYDCTERCAWYDKEVECCAIHSIAKNMTKVGNHATYEHF